MLTVHDRFLLPANPSIGVLHHRGKYYGFSSKEAADEFAGNPEGSVAVLTLDNAVSTFTWMANNYIQLWKLHVEKKLISFVTAQYFTRLPYHVLPVSDVC